MILLLQRFLTNLLILGLCFYLGLAIVSDVIDGTVLVEYGVLWPLGVLALALSLLQKEDPT